MQPHAGTVKRVVAPSELAAGGDDERSIGFQQRLPRRAIAVERIADLQELAILRIGVQADDVIRRSRCRGRVEVGRQPRRGTVR